MGVMFDLNSQQDDAIQDMVSWWLSTTSSQVYELSGRPGTGKTTLAKIFISKINLQPHEYIMCAYTGKATMQLIRKGNQARTIHSAFYHKVSKYKEDENGNPIMVHGHRVTENVFERKDASEIKRSGIKLIIIDEGRMVGKRIASELEDLGIKMLIMGDIDQLPPVMDKAHYLINPNRHLTQIMRQAEGDPIIEVSHKLIAGEKLSYGKYGKNLMVIPYECVVDDLLTKPDIVIASRNVTRDDINNHIRYDINKRKDERPYRGDKIICRKNNWRLSIMEDDNEISLVNGLSGTISNVMYSTTTSKTIDIDFQPDFTQDQFYSLTINRGFYAGNHKERDEIKNGYKVSGELFEKGDCITVHLSQGSEYPCVCYMLENFGYNKRYLNQLHYTAATRAQKRLIIVQ